MASDHRERLKSIRTFPSLVKYLREELDWPIGADDFEDMTFDYSPEELGIDTKIAAKIQEIRRLRPLAVNQPWGIFFIKFEPKRLPVVALRRILSRVALKKRASANSAERTAWQTDDLLFISNYGEGSERHISFAHFTENIKKKDLPTLKVLGWDNLDTALHLDHVADELQSKLTWPEDEADTERWRSRWRSAFTLEHRQVINTSKHLAVRLAELARAIRDRIKTILMIETEKGPVTELMKAFQEALIHDLDAEEFADMYAQTIAYGLLSARVEHPKRKRTDDLITQMPITNPFLKELMETFLVVGGRKSKKRHGPKIDFDELGVNEVVELLGDYDMEAVVQDFGNRNRQEDPVIHFYELFLKEYDAKKRIQRGVFYTPLPVVSFIVRSVDELLRTEFRLQDGLADTTTWGEMAKRFDDLKIPEGATPEQAFVQILDPATGTGTFLVEVIDLIYETMAAKWKSEGHGERKIHDLWNEYVPEHLLRRLHGYELMMAPYAIAHMKLGLKLYETGYRFESNERAQVYLTNSLEPPQDFSGTFAFAIPALAHEAEAVNEVKRNKRFTVVIGNPPYAGISSNMTEAAQRIVDPYKFVDGEALNERKLWLQDDYVKFIRTAQELVDASGVGILGYISNHGYLDNPTFRGMRQNLMATFTHMRLLDLHGNANKKERSPDGSDDKNVFDIRQGVAIFVGASRPGYASIWHTDVWGSRERKYRWLADNSASTAAFTELEPDSPYYFFRPQNTDTRIEYEHGWKINEAMPVNCAGFITARDHFVVDFSRDELLSRISTFADLSLTDAHIRSAYFAGAGSSKYPDGDTRGWKLPAARKLVAEDEHWQDRVRTCLYRPFDQREVYWADWMVDWPRPELTRHLDLKSNKALITTRITKDTFSVFVTRIPPGHKSVGAYDINYVFPLWSQSDQKSLLAADAEITPNYSTRFLESLANSLGVLIEDLDRLPATLLPDRIFNYIYAVFHSMGYAKRYADYLRIDFPRIPLPGSNQLYDALVQRGSDLVDLHLMESSAPNLLNTSIISNGDFLVEKVTYSDRTVWIDKERSRGFSGVSEAVWNFRIGGYQVCEKWLKDRQAKGGRRPRPGHVLTADEIEHYQKIVAILGETIRIISEIDEVIDACGGWPDAFSGETSE